MIQLCGIKFEEKFPNQTIIGSKNIEVFYEIGQN